MKIALAVAMITSVVGAAAAAPPPSVGAVAKAGAAITAAMRDPQSTQFRDIKLGGTCGSTTYVTGWANGKNGYGGYGGFKIFMVRIDAGKATVMQADGSSTATDAEFKTAAICNGDAAK